MPQSSQKINPLKALYIKLGRGGSWEKECLENGILRFGYNETPFDAAVAGKWKAVEKQWRGLRKDAGTATRDVTQIRHFFESGQDTIWITFCGGLLHWCFAKPGVKRHRDGKGTYRKTVGGWRSTDIHGIKLSSERLSGNLLKVQSFRGTICEIKNEFEYLKRKLNGEMLPEVAEAAKTEERMIEKIIPLMRLLTWRDFELLVDLVFTNSGWRRLGQVGKTQEDVDIELVLPTTGERAFVQIKSTARKEELIKYVAVLKETSNYQRMFFVWHSGEIGKIKIKDAVLIGPELLAKWFLMRG